MPAEKEGNVGMRGIVVARGVHRSTAMFAMFCAIFPCFVSRGLPVLERVIFYFTGTSVDLFAAFHTAQPMAGEHCWERAD